MDLALKYPTLVIRRRQRVIRRNEKSISRNKKCEGSADDNGSHGDNSEDSESVGDVAGSKEVGGGAASVELPPFQITDYTADTYDVHERTAHFMERRPISAANCIAVEAVYMVEALTTVRSMKTMRKLEIAAKVQAKYKELIQSIPLEHFSDMTLKMMM
jgi:hypothetical protein